MRRRVAAIALVAAGSILTGCGGGAGGEIAACDIDVTTPDLVREREAAGIADCTSVPTVPEGADPSGGSGEPLPTRRLDCLGGTSRLSLADVRGPAVINFWSTTCVPCRKEMPILEQFHRAHGDRVTLLGVNYADTYPGAAVDFARIAGATYPSVADACADLRDGSVVLQALPQFVWLRADGSWTQSAGGVESYDELVALAQERLGVTLDPASPAATGGAG